MQAKAREFEAPEEDLPAEKAISKKKSKDKESGGSDQERKVVNKRPDIEELKNKFLKKRKKE